MKTNIQSHKQNNPNNGSMWPEHAAARGTHDTVMQVLKHHVPDLKGKQVCDLPCGAGLFSKRLADEQATLFSLDIEEVTPYIGPIDRRILADANLPLPLEPKSIDVAISIEGVEHLENPSFFLRELNSLIKDDGIIIMTTPNVDSFRSRITTIWKGHPKYFNPVDLYSKADGHLHPVDMVFVFGAAARAGLEVIDVQTVKHPRDTGLALAMQELIRPFATRRLPEKMRSEVPFYGDVIIYVMQKAD